MFLVSGNQHVQYASLFFSIAGANGTGAAFFTWIANNTAPHARRATAIAMTNIIANMGGILTTWLLGVLSPAPRYFLATKVLLSLSVLMLVVCVLTAIFFLGQNRKKAKTRLAQALSEEKPGLGDGSAWFIYHL